MTDETKKGLRSAIWHLARAPEGWMERAKKRYLAFGTSLGGIQLVRTRQTQSPVEVSQSG